MSSIASPLTSSSAASASTTASPSSAATDPSDPLANESTFLTLLVSQLQNQDPLDPTDSNEFVTQLTGYSQLEQLIGIHQNTTSLAADTGTTPTTGSTSSTGTTSTTGN